MFIKHGCETLRNMRHFLSATTEQPAMVGLQDAKVTTETKAAAEGHPAPTPEKGAGCYTRAVALRRWTTCCCGTEEEPQGPQSPA